ncbi:hypothetical protein D1007_12313 [Hordeum vulgare]|nr:hypothetical protein D1007_12313 [Hordeum vulgare]
MSAHEEEIWSAFDVKTTTGHTALSSLDLSAGQALSSMCRLGLEATLVPRDAGYAEFSSELVKELEGASKKVDTILKEECHNVSSWPRRASSVTSSFAIPSSGLKG